MILTSVDVEITHETKASCSNNIFKAPLDRFLRIVLADFAIRSFWLGLSAHQQNGFFWHGLETLLPHPFKTSRLGGLSRC